jgi:hypothetical protein
MELADLGSVLAHLSSQFHSAKSLAIPTDYLLAFAREIQNIADEANQLATSLSRPNPKAGALGSAP